MRLQNPDNNVSQNDYKAQCKLVRNLFKQKLSHFDQNKIEKEAANSKRKFFNLFNETSSQTLTTHHNKQVVENIETFNTFFANIGVELAKAFDTKQKYDIETNTNTMFCFPLTSSKIIDTLRVLPLKFSLDCHNIHYFFLNKRSWTVSPLLETLYNECLKLGVIPQCLKIAKIVPFFKSGDRSKPTNYRPISLLPAIDKLFEKILYKRVHTFLSKNNTFLKNQFGFRSKLSNVDAIASLTEVTRANCFKSKNLTKCTFIDLKKAFDTVNHELLLKKCEHKGLRGMVLKVLESYLKDRLQYIKIEKVESEKKNVKCGVPQG